MKFIAQRVLPCPEGVFVVGDKYLAEITAMDFEFRGVDSMEIYMKNKDFDGEGLWSTEDFRKEFSIFKLEQEQIKK